MATTVKTPARRRAWALRVCLQAGMRLTPIRRRILTCLATQQVPVSLDAVCQADTVRGICDVATVYRTLMLLRDLEVIRQVSLPNKVSYFVLNMPGDSTHFLVCRCCGAIGELPVSNAVAALERDIAAHAGYRRLYHELVFFGICPDCQQHPQATVCVKVSPRARAETGFKPRPGLPLPYPPAPPAKESERKTPLGEVSNIAERRRLRPGPRISASTTSRGSPPPGSGAERQAR